MNREQLLDIIQHAMRPSSSTNGHAAPPSLASVIRRVQVAISESQKTIAAPLQPLPTAECVASFVDGNVSPQEREQVIRAAVHDLGILLQVVNSVQALDSLPDEVSDELLTRLIRLRHEPPEGKAVEDGRAIEDASGAEWQPAKAEEAMVGASSIEPAASPLDVAHPHRAETIPPPVVSPSTDALYDTKQQTWTAVVTRSAMVVAAACLVWTAGWLAVRGDWWNTTRKPPSAGPPGVDGAPKLVEDAPRTEDAPGQPEDISTAIDRLEQQLAHGQEVPPGTESPTALPEDPAPTTEYSVQNVAKNDSAAPVPKSSVQPDPMSTVDRVASGPTVFWTQVTGVLAQQAEAGYDTWQIVSRPSAQRKSSDGEAPEMEGDRSWLTLPTCYARGELVTGGELVMNQDTSLRTPPSRPGEAVFDLRFGSIALLNLPAGGRIRLLGPQTGPGAFEIDSSASLQFRRVAGGLQVSVESGKVLFQGSALPLQRMVTLRSQTPDLGPAAGLPDWATELPTNSGVSRQILANLDASLELSESIDRQLILLARNLKPNNAFGMKNFRRLCLWRTRLSIEDATAVTKHPLWFVRAASFDMALSPQEHLPSMVIRRTLMTKLRGTQAQTVRSWIEAANGRRRPTRQDYAHWLNMLTSDDPVVAAFADYLLRKRFADGPNFDPTAPATTRAVAQKVWRAVVAGD